MARKNYATQPWRRFSDDKMDTSAEISVDKILGAPEFATLTAAATLAKDACKDFRTALASASTGDSTAIRIKNAVKEDLATKMNNLAVDVNGIAKGDDTIVSKSGMPRNKTGGSPEAQQKPEGVNVIAGPTSGQAVVSFLEAKGSVNCLFQCTPSPLTDSSVWQTKSSTKKVFVFTNLPVGGKTYFRVISVGRSTEEMVSNVVSLYVN